MVNMCVKFNDHRCKGKDVMCQLQFFSNNCIVTLTSDLLTPISLGHILNSWGVCVWSLKMSTMRPGQHREPAGIYTSLWRKRIFHGVMVRIGKVEPKGWPVRSGPSSSEIQIAGLPVGFHFSYSHQWPRDYFSCQSSLIDNLRPQINVFYTFT